MIKKKKIFLIAILLLTCLPVNGKLRRTKLSKLVGESELIIKGKVIQATLNDDGFSGYAKIKIEDIIKGEFSHKHIIIHWDLEIHDQRISTIDEYRLLFLKQSNGKYTGTHYGISYIKLEYHQSVESVGDFVEYKHPTDLIEIDFDDLFKSKEILKIRKDMPFTPVYSDSIILLDDLVKIIKTEM